MLIDGASPVVWRLASSGCCGRLLGAKLLYEWTARRLGAGGFQTLATEVVGAATGFAFAALYLDADLLSRLPKTVVP